MPRTVLGCRVSKMANSDTCPRPTTGEERGPGRGAQGAAGPSEGGDENK
jgi:hypothetical protein